MTSRTLLAALLAALLVAAPAAASSTQESIVEDEYQMLQLGGQARERALDDVQALGGDAVRAVVYWRTIAPAPEARRRPAGFDGKDPKAYPAGSWDPLDDLVRSAQARGLGLLLSPSSPMPDWASQCRGRRDNRRTCKPVPQLFGAFVRALGTRYSGTYADDNQGGAVLPAVTRWSPWNEPNQPGWLSPQYERRGGQAIATAAHQYRRLASSALSGLRATGHSSDLLLLGETSPIGRISGSLARRPVPPVEFIRELFCLDARGRKLSGGASSLRGCGRYARLRVSGFAHHPYTRGGSQPPSVRSGANEITIASASRLKRLLDQGGRAGRIPRRLPVHYTEFGFQTNPPDRIFGVRPEQHARYVNESDYMAYRDPRVRATSQYKLIDEAALSSFQSGLRFLDGSPKPAYAAWRLPVWVVRRGAGVRVWGQVRPPADGAATQVEVLHRPDGAGAFETVQGVPVSSSKGFFQVTIAGRSGGTWKLRWDGKESREAEVARR